jgi:hypothetical protein
MPQICDMGQAFTSPPKEGVLRIFFALKNLTASDVFEPANLGTKGQHANSKPPKLLLVTIYNITWRREKSCHNKTIHHLENFKYCLYLAFIIAF